MAEYIIEVEGLSKSFDGVRKVLDNVNFKVKKGETLVILGGSGCGKSTLLKILVGIEKADVGVVKLFGNDIKGMSSKEFDHIRKRFGILFQSGALYNSMTLGENVALSLKEHTNLTDDVIEIMVKMKLEMVGLRDFEKLIPAEISGGMKKRVALARAIAMDPEIIFYDEPSAGLDPVMTAVIDELIIKFKETMNMTNVVVTHDMKSTFRIADNIIYFFNGRILAEGPPTQIQNEAKTNPYVNQFIEGLADGPIPLSRSSKDYLQDLLGLEEEKRK
ncbi:MAG: ABC transporter ATP-binding protein [Candidatus Hydrogenedentota bacterium]